MLPRHSAGGIIVHEGKLVLVWQNHNSWSFPKGGIEPGEHTLEAAWREVKEETGLGAPDLEYVGELGSYVRHSLAKDGVTEDVSRPASTRTLYLFTSHTQVLAPEDKEVSEARFVTLEEALELLTHEKDKEFLVGVWPKLQEMLSSVK